jgi:predicted RNase H-like nuclease (RuvC/YqgF family)
MLLNEFLKEHRKGEQQDRRIEQLDATVAKQQEQIERLTAALKEQAAQIQKVSAQVETSNPVSKVVLNTP